MENGALPVLAYVGPDAEVLFLQTLLDEADIECSVDMPLPGTRSLARREARLFVAQADADVAAPIIADFRQNGVKSRF